MGKSLEDDYESDSMYVIQNSCLAMHVHAHVILLESYKLAGYNFPFCCMFLLICYTAIYLLRNTTSYNLCLS